MSGASPKLSKESAARRACGSKDAVDAVLENGFRISHANLDVRHNRYGVGQCLSPQAS